MSAFSSKNRSNDTHIAWQRAVRSGRKWKQLEQPYCRLKAEQKYSLKLLFLFLDICFNKITQEESRILM